MSKTMRALYTE